MNSEMRTMPTPSLSGYALVNNAKLKHPDYYKPDPQRGEINLKSLTTDYNAAVTPKPFGEPWPNKVQGTTLTDYGLEEKALFVYKAIHAPKPRLSDVVIKSISPEVFKSTLATRMYFQGNTTDILRALYLAYNQYAELSLWGMSFEMDVHQQEVFNGLATRIVMLSYAYACTSALRFRINDQDIKDKNDPKAYPAIEYAQYHDSYIKNVFRAMSAMYNVELYEPSDFVKEKIMGTVCSHALLDGCPIAKLIIGFNAQGNKILLREFQYLNWHERFQRLVFDETQFALAELEKIKTSDARDVKVYYWLAVAYTYGPRRGPKAKEFRPNMPKFWRAVYELNKLGYVSQKVVEKTVESDYLREDEQKRSLSTAFGKIRHTMFFIENNELFVFDSNGLLYLKKGSGENVFKEKMKMIEDMLSFDN